MRGRPLESQAPQVQVPALLGGKATVGWELCAQMDEPTFKTTSNPMCLGGVGNCRVFTWRGRPLLLNGDQNPQEEGGLGVEAKVTP